MWLYHGKEHCQTNYSFHLQIFSLNYVLLCPIESAVRRPWTVPFPGRCLRKRAGCWLLTHLSGCGLNTLISWLVFILVLFCAGSCFDVLLYRLYTSVAFLLWDRLLLFRQRNHRVILSAVPRLVHIQEIVLLTMEVLLAICCAPPVTSRKKKRRITSAPTKAMYHQPIIPWSFANTTFYIMTRIECPIFV